MIILFRLIAQGKDARSDERYWVEELRLEIPRGIQYIGATVRREMRLLQFEIETPSNPKIEEIWGLVGGNGSKVGFDDEIEMYI
jgi:hypothetical protein